MEQQNEELYSMLVPLHQHRLIVPRACVAEVVRYVPSEPVAGEPAWLRGRIAWNDLELPLISFEELAGLPVAPPGGRTRAVVFHGIAGLLADGAFALLSEGFPQLVRVNRQVMESDTRHAWPEEGPIICQIRMINEYPLIPDLERVESLIVEQLSAAGVEPA